LGGEAIRLLPRAVAPFLTQQLSFVVWGKSASKNLPLICCKEAVKMVANKTTLSHEGFAVWEMPFESLAHLPCSQEDGLRAPSLVFYLLIPDPTLAVLLGLGSGDSW